MKKAKLVSALAALAVAAPLFAMSADASACGCARHCGDVRNCCDFYGYSGYGHHGFFRDYYGGYYYYPYCGYTVSWVYPTYEFCGCGYRHHHYYRHHHRHYGYGHPYFVRHVYRLGY